ncbi:MAG: hypothetical protein JWM11_1838 [Planctomycetaceae bacterium]|nr:hypothetical protein [Planctomycetaceae bacterium]
MVPLHSETGMKLIVMLRSRANPNEVVEEKFARFVNGVRGKDGPWAMQAKAEPKLGIMLEFLSSTKLNKWFGRGFDCRITYLNRRQELPDEGSSDDHCVIEFQAEPPFETDRLIATLALYARSFEAYLGFVSNEEFFLDGPVVDFRKKLQLVHPVNYWHKTFCQDAFGLIPAQVAAAINSELSHVEHTTSDIVFVSESGFESLGTAKKNTRRINQAIRRQKKQ